MVEIALPTPVPAPGTAAAGAIRVAAHHGAAALARLDAARAPSPFQSAGWIGAWLEAHEALASLRVIELADAAGNALLLPVGLSRGRFGAAACKIGGAHASFYLPAVIGAEPAFATGDLRAALIAGTRLAGADALFLTECPDRYAGQTHPLAALMSFPSPSDGAGLAIAGAPDDLLTRLLDREARKKLRAKQAKLAGLGPLRLGFAKTPAEAEAALAAFLDWKGRQFSAMGLGDAFAEPGIRRFFHLASVSEPPRIRHFTCHVGDRLVAMLAMAGDVTLGSVMVTAFDPDPEIARHSPGEVTFAAAIQAIAAEGMRWFDLGVGEARYKNRFAPEPILLHDLALAARPRGLPLQLVFTLERRLKGAIKRNPALYDLARKARRGFKSFSG